ncbi:MAG: hypothetical protein RQ966_17580 [Acetobacteraceae bacterium]|nr:hypothetical protein [Acetobacteraceae bacterium]
MQADDKAADYGESDIEATAMTQGAARPRHSPAKPELPAQPSPEASGTTESDIARNRQEKAEYERQR